MFQDLTPNFAKLVICSPSGFSDQGLELGEGIKVTQYLSLQARGGFSMARSFKYHFRFIPRATEGV